MQTSAAPARRSRALQVYAVLCALTGFSGMALSLWAHPAVMTARQEIAALPPETIAALPAKTSSSSAYLRGIPAGPDTAFSGPVLISADAR